MRSPSQFRSTALVLCATAALAQGQQPQQSPPGPPDPDHAHLRMAHVQGNVYVLIGDGGNISVQVGKDGIMLVDTGFAQLVPLAMAEIRKLSDGPIRWIVDTHVHTDHTGGNAAFSKLGMTRTSIGAPRIVAQSNVLNRMTGPQPDHQPKIPEAEWPNDEYFSPFKDFFMNGEAIKVYHIPNAHTDGDSIVFFRRSDVLATGDIFTPDHYPIIDLERGGSVQGLIAGLNRILEITVPTKYEEGGTVVIPGHGRLCDEADVVEYRNMVTVIRDRIQDAIKRGQSLAQVQEAGLTGDYDTQYGATTGFWTTSQFVEAVYKSLSEKKP
ncbi:MAG TPA: MBL fold metallo-hydrolase [Bryobacteraceae bacterium]|nr:MBL fold metallo-hydrolase [Bryobacteraceae bacterium]